MRNDDVVSLNMFQSFFDGHAFERCTRIGVDRKPSNTNPKKPPYPSEQMSRSHLVQLLSERFSQLTQVDVETAVSTILEAMNSAMVRGHRIEIRGFGSFSVIHSALRMGRNPRSGAPVEIPAARVPHFKLGKALRETVDLPAD